MTDLQLTALGVLVVALLVAWGMLAWASRKDRRGWIMSRAPLLPVGALSEHDDAWIRGDVRSATPLRCPWFDVDCVYYRYEIERKVVRTVPAGKGKTRTKTEWVTDHSESDQQPFTLVEGEDAIVVKLPQGELGESVDTGHDYEGFSRRHSARLLPVGKTVSALGVRLEDGTFGPLREVPLLVVFRERSDFLKRTAAGEKWTRRVGLAFGFLGGMAVWLVLNARPRLEAEDWGVAVAVGLAVWFPVWFLTAYNKFVRTRQQSEAAWRQVDVDLTVRDDLIPQLVAVVSGYRDHERELFEGVAELRSARSRDERIHADAAAVRVSRGLLGLRERYPELQANELFADLHGRLWALEEKLAASRNFYNGVCQEWNDLVEGFPSMVVAKVFGHATRSYFSFRSGAEVES